MHRYNQRGWRGSGLEGQTLPLHPCGQLTRCFSAVAELLVTTVIRVYDELTTMSTMCQWDMYLPRDSADAVEWRWWTTIDCLVKGLTLSVELKRTTTTDHHHLCAALPAHHLWRHRWRQVNDVTTRPRVRYTRCLTAGLSKSFDGFLSSCTVNRHRQHR